MSQLTVRVTSVSSFELHDRRVVGRDVALSKLLNRYLWRHCDDDLIVKIQQVLSGEGDLDITCLAQNLSVDEVHSVDYENSWSVVHIEQLVRVVNDVQQIVTAVIIEGGH